ncbi:MAG: glycosyltransferase family 2 protein [Actinobacteria bacterium]|nr:glycosyltransferase family 2 protein [Actinomycetota bacterium]
MRTIAIIPAYNAEKTIGRIIENTRKYVDEVAIINDGSKDNTLKVAQKHGATVYNHRRNMGLGFALRSGFREALKKNFDIIITLDADGQHDPEDIEKLINRLHENNVDVIIGSRLIDKKQWPNFPKHRLIGNILLTNLTNLAAQKKITTDSQSGYRILKKEVLEKINLTGKTMEIASEIIYEVGKNGFKTDEVPIKATYDKEISNIKIFRDISRIIKLLIRKKI